MKFWIAFKTYFAYDCMAFTLVVVFNSLINVFDDWNAEIFSAKMLLILFAITTLGNALIFATDHLPVHNLALAICINIADIFLPLFTLGPLTGMFEMTWGNVLPIGGMTVLVFFIIFGIDVLRNHSDADAINAKLTDGKKGEQDGTNH